MNPVDMNKSFDGLFGIVREEFQQDPLNGHLYLFVNKRLECGVVIPDFTEVSDLTGSAFRELGMSLSSQLPEEAMSAILPDYWAAANPKQVLAMNSFRGRLISFPRLKPPLCAAPKGTWFRGSVTTIQLVYHGALSIFEEG